MCLTPKTGLERLSGGQQLRIIPYESDESKQVLGTRYHGCRPDAVFLVTADGTIASGLDAFLRCCLDYGAGGCGRISLVSHS